MHDPMTVAFEIRYPWKKYGKKGRNEFERNYRESFLTIWHVDPERDGSDDSCGWFSPHLSKDQLSRINSISGDEARQPYYQRHHGKEIDSPTEAETLLRQAFMLIGKIFSKQHLCKPALRSVTFQEASKWACYMLANPVDNFRGSLSFLPGWHSNNDEDRESDRQYTAKKFFCCIGRFIAQQRRPWYRHPRWHIWHWKIQNHLTQDFKRWAFTRCATCNGRYKWKETGWTNGWDSEGPRWFRSEVDLHHMNCGGHGIGTDKAKISDPITGT